MDLFLFFFFLEGVHHTPLKYTHKFAHSEAPTYTLSLLASTASAPRHPARRRQLSRPRRSAGITSRQASARLYAAGRRGGPARSPRAAAGVAGDEMPACSEADRWPDLPRAAGFRRPEGWIFDSWGEWWWRGGGGGGGGLPDFFCLAKGWGLDSLSLRFFFFLVFSLHHCVLVCKWGWNLGARLEPDYLGLIWHPDLGPRIEGDGRRFVQCSMCRARS